MKHKAKLLRPIDYKSLTCLEWNENEEESLGKFLLEAHIMEQEIIASIKLYCKEFGVRRFNICYSSNDDEIQNIDEVTLFNYEEVRKILNFPNSN